ncbi:MAG TPA: M48 family metalloprotease [Terracidiphilus sp.]|jgi:hypothetical protein
MQKLRLTLVCLFLGLASISSYSQKSACDIGLPQLQLKQPNIFSEQQEQWLGDAQAAEIEPDYTLLAEEDTAELTRIGQKILAQLPPSAIHFTFRVYNSGSTNGFSIAGGHVYISRKLISDARNEDEVAAVIAHEIGHIYSRAGSGRETRELKALLNVTSLTDRRDVEDKEQLLLNAPWKNGGNESEDEREAAELQADTIALYAMTRAGYTPAALAENLDRITDTGKHSSLFLASLSGGNENTVLRLHSAQKVIGTLPADCKAGKPGSSPSFTAFQEKMRSGSVRWLSQPTPNLTSFALDPPLRPAIDWIRYSPNGAYILAQDNSRIHILSRAPLKLLFSIDAEDAENANFSPDSSRVSFQYGDRRVESWDIAKQTRISAHDLVEYRGCYVGMLAPDGKTFACLKPENEGVGISLLDVDTERVFYEDKKLNEYPGFGNHGEIAFSPDGSIMLALVGGRSFAFDLAQRKQISLHGHLSELIAGRVAFVGNNKLAFQCGNSQTTKDGAVFNTMCFDSFPSGEKLGKFPIGDQWVRSISHGDQVLVGPAGENAAILIDPATGTIQRAFRLSTLDLYDQALASETAKGELALKESTAGGIEKVELPLAPLPPISAGAFSADGKFLAYSHATRGSVWDLGKLKQVSLLRPFSSMRFDDQNHLQLHLGMSLQQAGANLTLDPATGKQTPGATFVEKQELKSGVLVYLFPLDKGFNGIVQNVELQVSDPVTGSLLWKRRFPKGPPDIYESDGDALVLSYNLRTDLAAGEISAYKDKLVKSSDIQKEWIENGLAIEILDAHTGEVRRILQTPTRPEFQDDARSVAVYGNYAVVQGNFNNTTVYRLSDGVRTCAFYGRVLDGDGKKGLLAVSNRDQEVIVYDASNGNELKRVLVDHRPRAARLIASTNSLLVLTATQRVYNIPLSGPAASDSASSR